MKKISLNAYGKINLSLSVGERDDVTGLHSIDSLMQTIDLCDYVSVAKRQDKQCTSTIVGMTIQDDAALRAAQCFVDAFDCNGVDIRIVKHIPLGGGLGGSSADAAAVLRGMAMLYDVDFCRLPALAAQIGCDVPFLLSPGFARATGAGDQLTYLPPLPTMYALLVFAGEGVSTAEAYQAYDQQTKKPKPIHTEEIESFLREKKHTKILQNNHLLSVATNRCPSIDKAIKALTDPKALHTAMSGSGSTVYNLYEELDDALAKQQTMGDYTTRICRLLNQ